MAARSFMLFSLLRFETKSSFRVMRDVEAIRDSLASEEPYQTWIPDEDYKDEELTCQTTYSERETTPSSGTSVHVGVSVLFLPVYFGISKLL